MDTVHRASMLGHNPALGLRKLTPKMLGTIAVSERHKIESEMQYGKVLAAFKAAAPFMGLRPRVVHAIDWLFRWTEPQDWQPSARPIVWPSAALQQQELGLGPSQVKNLNRYLVEVGLVAMKDSPNGKRYGSRDKGRIVEAYGFDLSPLASRFAEFQAIAEAGRKERALLQALKRRATIARNGIRQLVETALEQGHMGEGWDNHRTAASLASRGIAGIGDPMETEMAVVRLERIQAEMRMELEKALDCRRQEAPLAVPNPVNLNPRGPENWPHITPTNQLLNPKDSVIASGEGNSASIVSNSPDKGPDRVNGLERPQADAPRHEFRAARSDSGSHLKITPAQLLGLAPRLKTYLSNTSPRWPEIVDAADWLREELGISKFIWGDACSTMGREQASVAVAIVSARPASYFRGSPGAYFHGMVTRAKSGDLHLTRTLWGMRNQDELPQRRQ
jgi:replication initiation protein RepC